MRRVLAMRGVRALHVGHAPARVAARPASAGALRAAVPASPLAGSAGLLAAARRLPLDSVRLLSTSMRCTEKHEDKPGSTPTPSQPPSTPPSRPTPRTLRERIDNMWATLKYLFRFYLNGLKQIWHNRRRVQEIREEVKTTGRSLTWEETVLMRTHAADMRKVPLFLLILVTVEELLPLMVIYTPFLLPSTCILPNQQQSIRKRFEVKRDAAVKQLKQLVDVDSKLAVPVLERREEPDTTSASLAHIPAHAMRQLAVYVVFA